MPEALFDISGLAATGESLRDEALKRVEENANERWLNAARSAMRSVALNMATFSTDDVWAELERFWTIGCNPITTHEPRAMGSVMRWAVREGLCEPTARYEKSSRPECHARPVRVWRSAVYWSHDASWHELPDGKRSYRLREDVTA